MAKATLDDILKEQKKQTKLLKEVRGLLKQLDENVIHEKVVKKIVDSVSSDLSL